VQLKQQQHLKQQLQLQQQLQANGHRKSLLESRAQLQQQLSKSIHAPGGADVSGLGEDHGILDDGTAGTRTSPRLEI
jgi:hypothetical protein